jgi:hypothetical protein
VSGRPTFASAAGIIAGTRLYDIIRTSGTRLYDKIRSSCLSVTRMTLLVPSFSRRVSP